MVFLLVFDDVMLTCGIVFGWFDSLYCSLFVLLVCCCFTWIFLILVVLMLVLVGFVVSFVCFRFWVFVCLCWWMLCGFCLGCCICLDFLVFVVCYVGCFLVVVAELSLCFYCVMYWFCCFVRFTCDLLFRFVHYFFGLTWLGRCLLLLWFCYLLFMFGLCLFLCLLLFLLWLGMYLSGLRLLFVC